jgi:hypothetical protein
MVSKGTIVFKVTAAPMETKVIFGSQLLTRVTLSQQCVPTMVSVTIVAIMFFNNDLGYHYYNSV